MAEPEEGEGADADAGDRGGDGGEEEEEGEEADDDPPEHTPNSTPRAAGAPA